MEPKAQSELLRPNFETLDQSLSPSFFIYLKSCEVSKLFIKFFIPRLLSLAFVFFNVHIHPEDSFLIINTFRRFYV